MTMQIDAPQNVCLRPLAATPVGDSRGSFRGVDSTGRRNTPSL